MLWLKFLLCLLSTSVVLATSSPKATSQKTIQQKLINIASSIQNYEEQLSAIENELRKTQGEEKAILEELDQYNQQLMETIHYLRHARQYSPLLTILSASKPEDVVHSSILLRSITPEIHARNQHLLEKLKTLSHIRTQLETQQNKLRDITYQYHQERENLDMLHQNRLTTNHSLNENNVFTPFTLVTPVAGKIISTYKNPQPEWASFTQGILFITRARAHVFSPLSGKIALAGDYAKGQEKMVIVEAQQSHIVMSGLGTLNCVQGQEIRAGELIGQMPTTNSTQNPPRLYLEVWHQEQTINPQALLKEKRKES